MKQVLVRDIMTPIEKLELISAFAGMRELLQMMNRNNVRYVVVERSSEFDAYGIVTYTNVLEAIYSEDGDMDLINVYDLATKPMLQIIPNLDIRYAAQLMINQSVKHLAVTWEGNMVGVIAMKDIANVLMREAVRD